MKKNILALSLSLVAVSGFADTQANYWSGNMSLGMGWSSFSHSDTVITSSNPTIQNESATSSSSSRVPILGLGVSYNIPYADATLGLGVSAYYMQNVTASGTNARSLVGSGLPSENFEYSAQGQSYALMFEPKFTFTEYALQPYFLLGAGISRNDFGNYSETATADGPSSAHPYKNESEYNFAYEMGVGVQYVLSPNPNSPVIALDYRFMNWGDAGVAAFTGQENGNGLSFGALKTSSVNLSLILPF